MASYEDDEVPYEENGEEQQGYKGEEGFENQQGALDEDGAGNEYAENPYVGLTRSESFPVTEVEKQSVSDHSSLSRPSSNINDSHQAEEKFHPSIKVLSAAEEWVSMMGTIDTGCEDNWISQEKTDELGMGLEGLDDPDESFTTFSGGDLTPVGKVTIEWHGEHTAKTSHLECKVAEGVPFDVLFGRVYFAEHNFEDFESPVLILKSKPKTRRKLMISVYFSLLVLPGVTEQAAASQTVGEQYQHGAQSVTAARSAEQATSRGGVAYDGDDVPE